MPGGVGIHNRNAGSYREKGLLTIGESTVDGAASSQRRRAIPVLEQAGVIMDTSEIRKYLHDLSNALNAAKINAYLLRRMHGDTLDKETVDGLDSSLQDAEQLVSEFHRRVHSEIVAEERPAKAHIG